MSYPLVSVIMVVYNNRASVESTIKSVLAQDAEFFEFIVIDGASKDGTVEIIKRYEDHIAYFVSEPDQGIYHAMNKGVGSATGDYCIFMNSGDTFADADVIAAFSEYLKTLEYDVVYGDVITMSNNGVRILKKAELPGNKHRMYFCHQSAFAATSILKKYPFDESYSMSADFKFFKQCFNANCKFKYIPQSVSIFNLQGISKTQRLKGLQENIRVIKENDTGFEKIRLLIRIFPSYAMKWIRSVRKKDDPSSLQAAEYRL